MRCNLTAFILFLLIFSSQSIAASSPFSNDSGTKRIFKRSALEKEANILLETGKYNDAIEKYKEATNPALLNAAYEAGVAIGSIRRIHMLQGKYELALEDLQWHLSRNSTKYEKNRLELLALIKARDTQSPQPIYDHIEYLKGKYPDQIPPTGYGPRSEILASIIIRLYDHIGDFDRGIKFIDECLDFFAERDKKRYGKIRWGKGDEEYSKIKEAFLQDKAEGKKGCLTAKPAEKDEDVCIGRATKALIKSDYFPW